MQRKQIIGKMKYRFNIKLARYQKNKTSCVKIYGDDNRLLVDFKTDQDHFSLSLPRKFKYYHIIVHRGKIQLLSIFSHQSQTILLSEQTTIANIFSFSQLLTINQKIISIKATQNQLVVAEGIKNNFISPSGCISEVISNSPNGLETNSYPAFNFLSNLVFYCLIDSQILDKFLSLTNSRNLIEGLWNLARNPFREVVSIYQLIANKKQFYQPSLPDLDLPVGKSPIPNQWTLTLKFNRTGAQNFIFGGPGNLVFDKDNKVWINNNVRQGSPNSSTFVTILNSNGRPINKSPIFGGGLLGAGLGIAINRKKDAIAVGNFGWGPTQYNPQNGSITIISSDGCIKTPSEGFTKQTNRVQGLAYDNHQNLWMTSWGSQEPLGGGSSDNILCFPSTNSAIIVYLKGNPKDSIRYEFENQFQQTFDLVVDKKNNVYVSNGGNEKENVNSSVFKFRLVISKKSPKSGKIVMLAKWTSNQPENFRQVKVNSKGEVYVAAVRTEKIIKFDKDLNPIKVFKKNVNGPWGITFDSSDTIYLANFVRDSQRVNNGTLDMRGPFGVTIIKRDDPETAKFMTLPTGGAEVIMANGLPLYGKVFKSFEPLMRLTASNIDLVGNLWVVNNWKPALTVDITNNPGGDGVVVFVGVARPFHD